MPAGRCGRDWDPMCAAPSADVVRLAGRPLLREPRYHRGTDGVRHLLYCRPLEPFAMKPRARIRPASEGRGSAPFANSSLMCCACRYAFAPQVFWGAKGLMCVRRCPTFPPGLGSIIGAGRLSFRVRDGSGRFPVAISAVTLFTCCGEVVFGGGVWLFDCLWIVWLRVLCVSFRPVSASSLRTLLCL